MVFLWWWCFCGGVLVAVFFVVVFLCLCGGVFMLVWWRFCGGGVFVVVFFVAVFFVVVFLRWCFCSVCSRMRSEGFPFIVGVWGWTCVRVVFLVSSSCRRRLVVANSSPTHRQLVNSLPLGGTFALRHHPVFQSMESIQRKSRTKCLFWRSQVTKCEVIFVFWVTGAILWQCVNASVLFFRGRRSTL